MACGQVLQTIQSQLETVLHADFLEKTRQINLYRPFRDQQHGSNFLVLEPLAQQADQLTLALGEGDPLGRKEAVGERLFKPEFAFVYALQALDEQLGRKRF